MLIIGDRVHSNNYGYGPYCPECKSKDIHMVLAWR